MGSRRLKPAQGFVALVDGACLLDVDEPAWREIVHRRGGCRCFISPPCNACVEPATEDELNYVGYTYGEPGKEDTA